jgi:hypothetical protein
MNNFTVKRLLAFSFSLMGLHAYAQEPTNHPTVFAAATLSGSSIQLTWTGSIGANLPSHYVVLARIVPAGTFPVPADAAAIADDADLSDDLGAINVVHAVGANSTTFTGLPIDTDFEFIIYPYKTGGATDPDFKLDGTPLLATASTRRPTVTSPTNSTPNENSSTLGGTVSSDGGHALTARGTVWKTSPGVTASDNALAEGGTAVSVFSHSRTGFPHGTQIYYAAYATNIAGTSLSSESSFFTIATTPDNHPASVTATAVSTTQINLTFSSAASTGANTKGYIIVRNTGSAPPGSIAQDAVAPGSIVLGSCTLVTTITNLATTTYNDTGLTPNTDYYYAVIPFNWDNANPETYNYKLGTGFTVDNAVSFSASSNIRLEAGTASTTIAYRTHQNTPISGGNSALLGEFWVQDGGNGLTDADGEVTDVQSLTFTITNPANIRQIALFDGADMVLGTVVGTSVTFDVSGISLTATDNDDDNFTIRATFLSAVTDNHNIHLTLTSATAAAGGSDFAAINAGGPSTTTEGNVNRIVVSTTRFRFAATPGPAGVNQNFSLTVNAVDNTPHFNVDLDNNDQVELSITGGSGGGTLIPTGAVLNPSLANGTFTWSQLRIDAAGSYDLEASDDGFLDDYNDAQTTVVINSASASITTASLNACYGAPFQTLSGNIVITETDAAGFSVPGGTFSLALPSGFVFDETVTGIGPTVSGGSDISAPVNYSYPSSNVVQFSYTISGTANINSITISGLRIRAPHPGTMAPGPINGNITRLGGSAVISGDASGTIHGTVNAFQSPPPGTLGFTVTSSDGVSVVSPSETNFSIGSNPVNLIGSEVGGTTVFSGSGVTLVGSQYRFNPSSLAPGTYPITYVFNNGCEYAFTKNFTVYSSGINNLATLYCTNDATTGVLTVDASFLNQIGPGLSVDRFVYYDFSTLTWVNITDPVNNRFNPSLPGYQHIYNQSPVYGYPTAIFIGFYVCDGSTYPCNGASTRFGRYQMVEMRPAPSVTLDMQGAFCEDEAPITLVGTPANSANIAVDNFTADGGQSASISHATVGPNEVWTFSPATVSGVTPSTPQTFNISYKYTDPVTQCDATAVKSVTVNDVPTTVPSSAISPGAPHSIELCQGGTVGSFSANDATYTYQWYSDNPPTPANLVTTAQTFNPASFGLDSEVAGTTPYYVTRKRNGCESVNPLALSVVVNATPPAPTVADPTLEYCVNETIPDIVATGSNIRWYTGAETFIIADASPSAAQLGINNTVASTYTFYVTQEANGCEGFIPGTATLVTVTIKALPSLVISANSPVNQICTTKGSVSFTAIDQNDGGNIAPNGTWSGTGLSGVLNPFPVQGKTDLNPLSLSPGNYTLEYDYTSAVSGCSNTQSIGLTILPTITPNVSIGDVCDGFPAIVTNNSSINPGGSPSTIAQTQWTLGDGLDVEPGPSGDPIGPLDNNGGRTAGTYFNPTHIYPNTGTFQISGTMITSDGCPYAIPQQPVTVSPIPVVKFGWQAACRNGTSSTQFLALETSTPQVPIAQYNWNFNLNNTLTYSAAGTGNSPTVNYDIDGTDIVQLIAISPAQCRDTVEVPVYIVPSYPTITEDNAYVQDFDAGTDGWIAGGINSSWEHGNPQGNTVVGDASASGNGNAWDTNLTGVSNNGEQSWVLSPCFDFTQAEKPIISFDIWSDTPFQNDGAVLQYNFSGNILNDASWVTIGQDDGQGANWYDESGISSSPGNQAANDLGWTGIYGGWKKAAYKLDNLKGLSNIVFRVAFASNVPRREGFTFDNVFIGERSRTVLLESFTNSSAAANSKLHNNVFSGFSSGSQEVAKIQFHTPFPGSDPLNQANVEVNNSRAAFYGITNAKVFAVDGNVVTTLPALNALYDARVLTPSPLRIDINMTKDGELVRINSTLTNTTNAPLPTVGVNVFTTIVEKTITDDDYFASDDDTIFYFVAKEMLPTPAGLMIEQATIAPLETIAVPEVVWKNRDLISSGNGAVVVYVQSIEGGNKNVYQARIVDATEEPDMITGLEPAFADQIIVYPNPATGEMNVKLPSKSSQSLPVTLTDNFGRTVFTNVFKPGEQVKTIITREFAAGVYFLQIKSEKGEMARKKVMVVNR